MVGVFCPKETERIVRIIRLRQPKLIRAESQLGVELQYLSDPLRTERFGKKVSGVFEGIRRREEKPQLVRLHCFHDVIRKAEVTDMEGTEGAGVEDDLFQTFSRAQGRL